MAKVLAFETLNTVKCTRAALAVYSIDALSGYCRRNRGSRGGWDQSLLFSRYQLVIPQISNGTIVVEHTVVKAGYPMQLQKVLTTALAWESKLESADAFASPVDVVVVVFSVVADATVVALLGVVAVVFVVPDVAVARLTLAVVLTVMVVVPGYF